MPNAWKSLSLVFNIIQMDELNWSTGDLEHYNLLIMP